jgi:regulator of sirC expression with transglutaminase-like and TPR domain
MNESVAETVSAVTGAVPAAAPSKATAARHARTFEELARQRDEDLDVALGAALIARDVYPSLDIAALIAKFDELAAPLAALGLASMPPAVQAKELARYVYEVLGFKGNEAEYYDPKNSLLVDVVGRKLGIPITLALVYVELARRAGVDARGVGFPGHFLVRIDGQGDAASEPLFVDPFFGGRVLDRDALLKLLRRATGPNQELKDEHLAPASPRTILVRMLINLKWIYTTRGDLARAHLALDRIVSLTPDAVAALRERGMLAARLGAVEAARADLTRLLEIAPDAPDAGVVRTKLEELRSKSSKKSLN